MINAEELGLNSANIDSKKMSKDPAIQRFLGMDGPKGKGMDLSDDWAWQIVRQVGNYGEVFDRNVGMASPLKIKRGLNSLWSDGGIMYAPPHR